MVNVYIGSFDFLKEYVKEHELSKENDGDRGNYVEQAMEYADSENLFDYSSRNDIPFYVNEHREREWINPLEDGLYALGETFLEMAMYLVMETEDGRKPTKNEMEIARDLFDKSEEVKGAIEEFKEKYTELISDCNKFLSNQIAYGSDPDNE